MATTRVTMPSATVFHLTSMTYGDPRWPPAPG